MTEPRFPMSELVRRTGTPAATVHHYLAQRLLPAPQRPSPTRFLYDERHVVRLRLIRLLRDRRGLGLPVIRRVLPELAALGEEEAFRTEMWDQVVAPHTRRARRRGARSRLLEAAKDAFSAQGLAEVHIDGLCASARVAKGSFYRHFRSKEELFLEVARVAAEDVAEDLRGRAPGSSLAAILRPRLPMFLDVAAGAVRGLPGYRAAARAVYGVLAGGAGTGSREEGARILGPAIAEALDAPVVPGSISGGARA